MRTLANDLQRYIKEKFALEIDNEKLIEFINNVSQKKNYGIKHNFKQCNEKHFEVWEV